LYKENNNDGGGFTECKFYCDVTYVKVIKKYKRIIKLNKFTHMKTKLIIKRERK
jgi:hypothetical protein